MTKRLSFRKISTSIIVCVTIFTLCSASLPNIKDFYYWKDDWVFLWSNKLNPSIFYLEAGGQDWAVKTGLFVDPYIRLYGRIPLETFQSSGIYIKFINSLLIIALAYTLTRNKNASILSGFLYAAFSGAADMYTWHRETAIAAGFAFLAIIFNNIFLSKLNPKFIIGVFVNIILGLLTYFGRVIGVFPLLVFSTLISFCFPPRRVYFIYLGLLILASLFLVLLTSKATVDLTGTSISTVLLSSVKHFDVLVSNLGNLLRIPFFPLWEQGGLVGNISHLSLVLGTVFIIFGPASILVFLLTRSRFWYSLTFIWAITFMIYLPNWLYAPGGVATMISSSSRYFAISAAFLPLTFGVIISKFKLIGQIIAFVPLLVLCINYSQHIVGIESSIRNRNIVAQIYQKVIADTQSDPLPRVLVIDTTKSNLTSGWFPYAYAYFKGIKSRTDFPTVFTNETSAREWLCAPADQKALISSKYGVPDNQSGHQILKSRIHSWRVVEDGTTTETTTSFLNGLTDCIAE